MCSASVKTFKSYSTWLAVKRSVQHHEELQDAFFLVFFLPISLTICCAILLALKPGSRIAMRPDLAGHLK
jgi:hypothetical protein